MRLRALLNAYLFFGAGASSPTRLVEQAAALGYSQVALTDANGVCGAVELHQAARKYGVEAIVGSTPRLEHEGKSFSGLQHEGAYRRRLSLAADAARRLTQSIG